MRHYIDTCVQQKPGFDIGNPNQGPFPVSQSKIFFQNQNFFFNHYLFLFGECKFLSISFKNSLKVSKVGFRGAFMMKKTLMLSVSRVSLKCGLGFDSGFGIISKPKQWFWWMRITCYPDKSYPDTCIQTLVYRPLIPCTIISLRLWTGKTQ